MSPLKQSTNIAARMGRWSARHRKIAIFGWLAFVDRLRRHRRQDRHEDDRPERRERGRGPHGRPHRPRRRLQARRADGVRARPVADEEGEPAGLPCRRGRHDHEARELPAGLEAPFAVREGQRGPDLARRPLGADPVQPEGLLRRGRQVHRHDHRRHRRGAESPSRLPRRRGRLGVDRQGARRDVQLAARARRADLDPDHPAHPAARVPLARGRVHPAPTRTHGRVRNDVPRRDPEPHRPDGSGDLGGDPPDRACGRSRLFPVLHPPRTRRAAQRQERDGRPRGRRGDIRPGRAHLRRRP